MLSRRTGKEALAGLDVVDLVLVDFVTVPLVHLEVSIDTDREVATTIR